jgi:hypothetical protein
VEEGRKHFSKETKYVKTKKNEQNLNKT